MNARHTQAMEAFADVQRLTDMHRRFLDELQKRAARMPEYGSVIVTGTSLRATCFGTEFSVAHRLVAVEGRFTANEYAFFAKYRDQDQLVYTLYLPAHGTLYGDIDETQRICDFNNSSVVEHVVSALGDALLRSPLVAGHATERL